MDEVLGFDIKSSVLEGELIGFGGGAPQKKKLRDYIDINELRALLEQLHKVTGISTSVLDESNRMAVSAGGARLCQEFHRKNEKAAVLCARSAEKILSESLEKKMVHEKCLHGIWGAAIPIRVAEDDIGSFSFGQFLLEGEAINEAAIRDKALEYGFSPDKYIEAWRAVPRYSEQKVQEIADLCIELVQKFVKHGWQADRQKQVEKALRNHASQLIDMFNHNSVIMYLVDAETFEILDANLSAERYYGYSNRELQEMTLFDLTSNSEETVLQNIVRAVSGRQIQFEAVHKRKDGELREVDLRSTMITMQNGKRAIFIIVNDITELKSAQSKLSASEAKYRTLTNQLPVGVYRVTLDGKFIFVNNALANLLGYESSDEIIQFRSSELFYDAEERGKNLMELVSSQKPMSFEYKLVTKLGKVIFVRDTVQHIKSEATSEEYLDGVIEDITERKLAAEKLERMNEELESAVLERTAQLEEALEELTFENYERKRTADELLRTKEELDEAFAREKEISEMKTRLISMVSHEYRTPLTVILSATYLLDKFFKINDEKSFLHNISLIQTSVKNMTQMINEALKIEKIESDEISCSFKPVDLSKLSAYIVKEVASQSGLMHKLTFKNKSINSFAPTDENLLYTIINNVLSNSIKFSPKDSWIEVELTDTAGEVVLSVADQGIGIPAGEIRQVFEPFYKGSNVKMSGGTGLGLSVVKRYCDLIRAEIDIESQLGEGSTVTIKFPRVVE